MVTYEELLAKGFSKKEAQHTIDIINRAQQNKHPTVKLLDLILYWVMLIIAIIGNLVISILLVPFLLTFKKAPLYLTIIILAALFGFLFDQLIRDIENLENKHQISAWLFIPAMAIITTYFMVSFLNYVIKTLSLPFVLHPPILISVTYVISFITPFTLRNILELQSKF